MPTSSIHILRSLKERDRSVDMWIRGKEVLLGSPVAFLRCLLQKRERSPVETYAQEVPLYVGKVSVGSRFPL